MMADFGDESMAAFRRHKKTLRHDVASKPHVTENRYYLANAFDRELARLLSSACK
jgi:hypothetical protein